MSDSMAFGSAVMVLASAVFVVMWLAVSFVRRSRLHARRPYLPADDRPPRGLAVLSSTNIPREVDAGLATLSGYLRRRTLHG
ncbi:MAG: hypothetical protein QOG60_111 [Frankiaceae bacterium]|nr:hypothetical protein [Frankiaceae bacterium]